MTEAFRELLRFAFEENGVCRVTTGCDRENKGSENVMIKCGMIKEADMKKKVWMHGELRDRVEYRLLNFRYHRERLFLRTKIGRHFMAAFLVLDVGTAFRCGPSDSAS